ncbi:E3 ubiquitin-protein ligase RNF146-A-like [Branchiostoma floridae x Branchiostoma japonicum]
MAESGSLSSTETSLRQSRAKNRKENEEMAETATGQKPGEDMVPECAVCLQTCVQPVRLPCTHIFCYLCVKGVANQSKRCALCRQEIPIEYLERPELVKPVKVVEEEEEEEEEVYCWFYEGRNGWWQYDERTNAELEDAYTKKKKSCELLIAGFLYIIDFVNMLQFRRNDPSRRRRIKRDLTNTPKKGVAGVRLPAPAPPRNAPADGVEGASEGATGGNRSVTVTSRATSTKSSGGSADHDEDTSEENANRAEEDTTSEDLMDQSAHGIARLSPDSLRQHTPTQEEDEEDTNSSGGAEMSEMVRMLQRSHLGRGSDSSRSGVLQAVLQGQISSPAPVAMAREAIPGDSSDESD